MSICRYLSVELCDNYQLNYVKLGDVGRKTDEGLVTFVQIVILVSED